MKTKNILLSIIVMVLTISYVSAEYRIYDNVEDFESAKWSICETATDGCNTFFMTDGKVAWWTRMYCANHTPEWNCTKFKENSISTMALPVTTSENITTTTNDEPVACTMEYAPVCWIDGKTYSNRCGAEKWAKIEVAYEGKCKTNILSDNDLSFYNSIKEGKLDQKYQEWINNTIIKYNKLINKYTSEKQKKINSLMIKKIEKKISNFLLKFPQDKGLSEKDNNIYLTYTLLKFELMKLEF